MNNYKALPSVVLLNSEGDILKVFKTEQGFMVMDQHKEIVASMNAEELHQFTRGELNITDSQGREFNYSEYPMSMKPNLKMLDEFIGIN